MKKEINLLLLLSLGIIVAVVAVTIGLAKEKVDYNEVTKVKISVTNGMSAYNNTYTLTLKNGTWFASYAESPFEDDYKSEVVVDEALATRIINTLKKYRVHRWDDFSLKYEIEKKVSELMTDASSYSFYMQFADGSTVQTSANASPNNFTTVLNTFKKEFEPLFAEGE